MAMVCHMTKFTASDCGGVQVEDNRESEKINEKNPDLDLSKTAHNIHYNYNPEDPNRPMRSSSADFVKVIRENRKRYETFHGKKMRKDAVVCCSFIIGCSHDEMCAMSQKEQIRYFEESMRFFGKKYGIDNVMSMSIHFDEKTPHAHLRIYPEFEDHSVSAKRMFTRSSLSTLQRQLWQYLTSKGFQIDAPVKGSDAKHLNELDFKIQQKRAELDAVTEQLEKRAEQLDYLTKSISVLGKDLEELLDTKEKLIRYITRLDDTLKEHQKPLEAQICKERDSVREKLARNKKIAQNAPKRITRHRKNDLER